MSPCKRGDEDIVLGGAPDDSDLDEADEFVHPQTMKPPLFTVSCSQAVDVSEER
jgi:hypothetical protein